MDTHAVLDGWSAAYTAGETNGVAKFYWPNATLFDTAGGRLVRGSEAIAKHYASRKVSGTQNRVSARHTVPLGLHAVLITGDYEFLTMKDGKPDRSPARFTMLFTNRNGEWRISHHHSSSFAEARR